LSGPAAKRFPAHGWLGLGLVIVCWPLNWGLDGLRTHLCFFPLWLGYCLTVDGLAVLRRGTSLLTRSAGMYLGLFLISVPVWWGFEAVNLRTGNWHYLGREHFSDLEYAVLASLSFSTVIPAVMGTAELFAPGFAERFRSGPRLGRGPRTAAVFAAIGLLTFVLTMAWPRYFFPLVWLSFFFLLEAFNLARGYRSLVGWTGNGDWRPVAALWSGALVCGFFWEMWNFWSYPKWVYTIPFFDSWQLFEMPLLGYGGYLPFSLELFAAVHLVLGLAGRGRSEYVTSGLVALR
jgi:hypothetical protein